MRRNRANVLAEPAWARLLGALLSTAGGEGRRPVVFLQGDQLGKFNVKTWTWIDTSAAKDVDTDDIIKMTDGFSKEAKTTAIYLARIRIRRLNRPRRAP